MGDPGQCHLVLSRAEAADALEGTGPQAPFQALTGGFDPHNQRIGGAFPREGRFRLGAAHLEALQLAMGQMQAQQQQGQHYKAEQQRSVALGLDAHQLQ